MRTGKNLTKILPNFGAVLERPRARLRNYSHNGQVVIKWDLNKETIKDQMFELCIDNKCVLLDLEEFNYYTRAV